MGLTALGILDTTGIPLIVEGIVGQRAWGPEMNAFERGERIGSGLFALVAMVASVVKGVRGMRGGGKAGGTRVLTGDTTLGKVEGGKLKAKDWRKNSFKGKPRAKANRSGLTLKQKNRIAVRNLDRDGGHSDADHGSHVTKSQHEIRLKTGRAPSGRVATPPGKSSSFYSDTMHLRAYHDALLHLEVEKYNSHGGLKLRVPIRAKPMRGVGKSYTLDSAGYLIESECNAYTAIFELNVATSRYRLITLYPE